MVSIKTMIDQVDGLRGTDAINDWEEEFIGSCVERFYAADGNTTVLSAKQVEKIEQIWRKHFA